MLKAQADGRIISISQLLDSERLDDIAEIVKETFGPHCLPFNPACGVLYINQTALDKIGISATWEPETFEDLIEMSQRSIEESGVENGYTCAWPEAYLAEVVLAQQNKSLLSEKDEYNFTQLSEHIFHMWELVQQRVFLAPPIGNYDPTRRAFRDRKVVFYMQGSGHYTAIKQEVQFEMRCAPLSTLSKEQTKNMPSPWAEQHCGHSINPGAKPLLRR